MESEAETVRVVCATCQAHMRGNPAAALVSHSLCPRCAITQRLNIYRSTLPKPHHATTDATRSEQQDATRPPATGDERRTGPQATG